MRFGYVASLATLLTLMVGCGGNQTSSELESFKSTSETDNRAIKVTSTEIDNVKYVEFRVCDDIADKFADCQPLASSKKFRADTFEELIEASTSSAVSGELAKKVSVGGAFMIPLITANGVLAELVYLAANEKGLFKILPLTIAGVGVVSVAGTLKFFKYLLRLESKLNDMAAVSQNSLKLMKSLDDQHTAPSAADLDNLVRAINFLGEFDKDSTYSI